MIEVDNLSVNYKKNDTPVLKNIRFSISKGQVFGFLGPSGAGKSTTQKVLTRLLRNYRGKVNILGKDLDSWNSSFYNHIGVGFELPNHYLKLTAEENLLYFSKFYSRDIVPVNSLLRMVGLSNDASKRVEEFSKGMKMRLNFARAIMHDPEILLFDEPTSGLDPANAHNLKQIILQKKTEGKTIFLTTHNMHDAEELCDQVAFIVDGQIKLIDSPKLLRREFGKRILKVETSGFEKEIYEFELDGLSENQQFQDILRNNAVLSMHTDEASMEEIFIKVTGKALQS
jgi:fluoroquinolone transport system ATP-binding protein